MRSRCVSLVAFLGCLLPAVVRAETPAISTAQSLFDEGRTLLETGRVHAACAKFAESQRLDPAGGTLLNLALCHERETRIATARTEFEAAIAQAIHDDRRDREEIAREHFEALGPRLPRLVVILPSTPNLVVSLDGAPLSSESLRTPFAVDPGLHTVSARAPGRRTTSVEIHADEGLTSNATIPELPLEPSSEPAVIEKRHGAQHWAGVASIVVGGTAMTVGAGLFLITPILATQSSTDCLVDKPSQPSSCDGMYERERDQKFRIAAITAGAGAAVALAGLVLVITAPSTVRAASARIRLSASGLELTGTF